MLSSKTTKVIKSIIFCLVLVLCSRIMTFLLYPFSSLNQRFVRYHRITRNIDFLVLGNSLENDGFVPEVIEKNLGQYCGLLAPQGSYPESLYYLLVDAAHTHKVKTVVAGWDIMQNFQLPAYKYPHSEELYREFFADMKGNTELQKIVFKNVMEQRYTSTFFDWSSFPENITQIPKVFESRKKVVTDKTMASSTPIDESTLKTNSKWNYEEAVNRTYGTEIQESDKAYFLKIQEYCKKRGIDFYVISCPIPECIYEVHPELKTSIAVSRDFFKEHGISYIDTTDEKYFPQITRNTNFSDCFGHIITPYNETYTQYVCDWIRDNGNN